MGRVEAEHGTNGVVTIWLDNAGRKNALDQAMLERMAAIFEGELASPEVKTAIVRGRNGLFCAGRDVSDIAVRPGQPIDLEERLRPVRRLALAVRSSPVPAIAMVEGLAVGLGVALICWCDFAVCASNATFAIPEARIGIPPSFTAMSLAGAVAPGVVRDLIATGRTIDAGMALRSCLVTRAFEEGGQEAGLAELVSEITRCSRDAVAGGRKLLREAGHLDFAGRMDAAYATALSGLASGDAMDGIHAFRERPQGRR